LDKDGRDLAARNRQLVEAKMTPAEIAEAQKLADERRQTRSGKLHLAKVNVCDL
jgi:hypothetical protein